MALTPDGSWVYLTVCRFLVGFGVSGLFAVDLPLVQEFVPTHKRGWVGGLVTTCLPLGNIFGATPRRISGPGVRLARSLRDRPLAGADHLAGSAPGSRNRRAG